MGSVGSITWPWTTQATSPSDSETNRHWTVGLIDAQNKDGLYSVVPQNKQTFVLQVRYIPKMLLRRTLFAADRRHFPERVAHSSS